MSRKANPTVIGVFIVLGLALAVASVLVFSSSRIFARTKEYILYFDATLTGLDPGAAVRFRGVNIGFVKEVLIHLNQSAEDTSLPVVIVLNEDRLRERGDGSFNLANDAQLEASIKRGLRGKLEAQSLLTGLLYVELEFLPDAPPPRYHQLKPLYQEIPTAPPGVQIFRVDFAEITQKLNALLTKLDTSLSELQVREINRGLTNVIASIQATASSPEFTNTLASARQAFDEFRQISTKLRSRVDGLADAADETLTESRDTVVELRHGVQDLRDMLAPQAPFRQEVQAALEQLSEAGRALGEFAEFLKRHPNALLSGKKNPEAKP
jgi:paraquat-inducible protein B